MSGKRYSNEPKLNMKKVLGVAIGIIVIIMFIITITKLLKNESLKTITKEQEKYYFSVYTNNKWGVIDNSGNIVITPEQEEMIVIPNKNKPVFLYTYDVDYENKTYKTKAINEKKEELYSGYEEIKAIDNYDKQNNIWYEENVLSVKKEGKYGLINFDGKEILPCKYDEIYSLKGLKNTIVVKKDNLVGLVNNFGEVLLDAKYKDIKQLGEDYKKEFIIENEQDLYGIIAVLNQKVVIEPKYEQILNVFETDTYVVKENGTLKVIGKDDNVLVESGFDDVKSIDNANLVIVRNKKYGVMNTSGEEIIKPEYEDLTYAFSDYYVAKKGGKYGVIDLNSNVVLDFTYNSLKFRKDADFFVGEDLNSVVIDKNFEVKLTGILSDVNTEKGYIRMRVDDEYKYYNFKFDEKKNTEVLTSNNIFLDKKDGKYGFINIKGEVVVDYIYEEATEQNKYGYTSVKKDGLWRSLNKAGKEIEGSEINLDNSYIVDFIDKWHLGEDINANYYCK